MSERAKETVENGGEAVSDAKDSATNGIASRVLRKELLIPVAATAATALAGVAAKKANVGGKVKDLGSDTAENLGRKATQGAKAELTGGGGITGVASKAIPGVGGGGGGSGKGKTRRLQIQRWTDIAAPVDRVYEEWTNFEEYPKFMHRVLSVKQDENDEKKIVWDEKIWFSKRHWEGEIVEQHENELISWKTTSGMSHAGLVSFHRIDDNLTRVMVDMDFRPTGLIEKMASGLRFVKRAVQADLARFKSYVEFQEAGLEEPQERLQQVKQEEKDDKKQDKSEGEGDKSDDDRESERSERQERREQRREKTAA